MPLYTVALNPLVQVGAKVIVSGFLLEGRHAQQRQWKRPPVGNLSAQDVRLYLQTPEKDANER